MTIYTVMLQKIIIGGDLAVAHPENYSVHHLITFSIVLTNKNRSGGTFSPPLITKVNQHRLKFYEFQFVPKDVSLRGIQILCQEYIL